MLKYPINIQYYNTTGNPTVNRLLIKHKLITLSLFLSCYRVINPV